MDLGISGGPLPPQNQVMHDMSDMRWSFNSDGNEGYEIWIWIRSPVQPRAGVNQRIETKWGSVRARHARKLCKQHYDDSADVEILVESSIASSFEIEQLALPTASNEFLRIVKTCHFCHPHCSINWIERLTHVKHRRVWLWKELQIRHVVKLVLPSLPYFLPWSTLWFPHCV